MDCRGCRRIPLEKTGSQRTAPSPAHRPSWMSRSGRPGRLMTSQAARRRTESRTIHLLGSLRSSQSLPNIGQAGVIMPLRSFVDRSGVHWDVWEAHPRLEERRTIQERRSLDRAGEPPRRVDIRRTSPSHTESEGWLVFHSALERRRQRPIPPGWAALTNVELEALMVRARPSGPRSRLLE